MSSRSRPAGSRRALHWAAALGLAGLLAGCFGGPPEERVVFFGGTATEWLKLRRHFSGQAYVNRGHGGVVLAALLERVDREIVRARPRAVVIEIDAANFGSAAPRGAVTRSLYLELLDRVQQAGARPVLVTLVPVSRAWAERRGPDVLARMQGFNAFVRAEARRRRLPLADAAAALAAADGCARPELTRDGLRPSARGYEVLAGALRPALDEALGRRRPAPLPPRATPRGRGLLAPER